jgi:type II secretory pathway predicted ATPase ExeA
VPSSDSSGNPFAPSSKSRTSSKPTPSSPWSIGSTKPSAWELEVETSSCSRAALTRIIRKGILDLFLGKKQRAVLIVDEASLLRLDVFAELHTLSQFDADSKPILPVILAGQNNLLDKLH